MKHVDWFVVLIGLFLAYELADSYLDRGSAHECARACEHAGKVMVSARTGECTCEAKP